MSSIMGDTAHTHQDLIWVLFCAGLVMLMQAGFCCLESGLVRSKNSINVAVKNLVDFCIASLLYWAVGFGVMFGATRAGVFGTTGFLFDSTRSAWDSGFFFYQVMFCGTATTIVAGAVAERMRLGGYLLVSVITCSVIYPFFGHWAWGGQVDGDPGGWLNRIGFIDFAGATVVHSVGGWVALAAVLLIGPRIGRFGEGGSRIPGHNIPLATLGAMLLWFGWFGFNGGGTFGIDDRVPGVLINTCLGGAAGGVGGLSLSWMRGPKTNVEYVINGVLAGLVSVTAGCHVLAPWAAVIVGGIGCGIAMVATQWLERRQIDDVIGAIPVHAMAGVWGTMAVGLFGASELWKTGLNRWEQIGVQALGVGVCFLWSFGVGFSLIWAVSRVVRLRPTEAQEREGMNFSEHGATTAVLDLLKEMDHHRRSGEFTKHVSIEPHTEVGQIADQYNRVLDEVNTRSNLLVVAKNEAVHAQGQLETSVCELREFNRLAVGREHRMIELKTQANELARELGHPEPYDLSFVSSKGDPAGSETSP